MMKNTESPINRPSAAKPGRNYTRVNVKRPRPFGDVQCLSVVSQEGVAALVFILLASRNPYAISGFVIPVIILSLDSESLWARPHVSKEVLERISPTLANGNPSTSVVFKILILRITAAILYVCPRFVGIRCSTITISRPVAVSPGSRAYSFNVETSAALCMAVRQVISRYFYLLAAVAQTEPANLFRSPLSGLADYCQTTESFSCEVNKIVSLTHDSPPVVLLDWLVRGDPARKQSVGCTSLRRPSNIITKRSLWK